ncbi:UPF0235 protein C15orf40 homolog [Myxocyprinus asiaticus]|uniref:UPF0235 protein C15orf40 homolog n=1 Tax=Myxocyprinus asiaticus TaxID=70543 RepID=UPI002222D8ED|nr:UPF0235 protein C15orf40 homolog [Myxocyprinus asiaticus]
MYLHFLSCVCDVNCCFHKQVEVMPFSHDPCMNILISFSSCIPIFSIIIRISSFPLLHLVLFSRTLLTRQIALHSSNRGVYSQYNTMPKKDKTSKSYPKQPETPPGGEIAIVIHAKPGAKQNAITDVSMEAVGVAIVAPQTDGEVNAELVRYLSKVLQLKKSEIFLEKGFKSREKFIQVAAAASQEEILEKPRREATG